MNMNMTNVKQRMTIMSTHRKMSYTATKVLILGVFSAVLCHGSHSRQHKSLTNVAAENSDWTMTATSSAASKRTSFTFTDSVQSYKNQQLLFNDLSSDIVEVLDGYHYDHRPHPKEDEFDGIFDMEEGDDDGDLEEEDDLYYFMRHGHRKTQESSTSTRVNIFQKLGESLGLTIIGCCLIALMPCLIWTNEGRHVRELARIDFCKNKAVAIDCTSPTDETVGRLVHFSGDITVGNNRLSFGSGGSLDLVKPIGHAIVIRRRCFIWQKFEVAHTSVQKDTIGGGETRTVTYTMREDWTPLGPQKDCPHIQEGRNSRGVWDQLVAAAGGSAEPVTGPAEVATEQEGKTSFDMVIAALGGIDNNRAPHAVQVARTTRVGEFALSEKIITGNPQVFADYVPVPTENIPDYVTGCEFLMKGSDNTLRSYNESDGPSNGDVKVVYEYVMDSFPASFLVAQTSSPTPESEATFGVDPIAVTEETCFGQCQEDLGQIWMVRKGNHTLFEMIEMAKEEEAMTVKLIRVVGWILLCVGWVMLFSPFLTALQVLPLLSQLGYFAVVLVALIVSALCCCTVMILAYIRYRPMMAGGLLVVALGIWGIVAWRLDIAADTGGETNSTNRF